jgi:heparosan-N-sulfate-glucuronate 5-epimerase
MQTYVKGVRQKRSIWETLPIASFLVSEWHCYSEERAKPHYRQATKPANALELSPYPIDMLPLLALPFGELDEAGVPYNRATKASPAAYQPTTIAQYALAHWNRYLATENEDHHQAFMIQARWLMEHAVYADSDLATWPIPFPSPAYNAPANWLSALTQGNCISVLVRAYQLTQDESFLQVARRAVRTFERDIRDGGVRSFVGEDGIFFEEVAVYPATHILNGYILALFGLYDFVALTKDAQIADLIERSVATLRTLIDKFDTGYWSCYDLHFRHLASYFYHALHITLLEALARYASSGYYAEVAARWRAYQQSHLCRFRYFTVSRMSRYFRRIKRIFLTKQEKSLL